MGLGTPTVTILDGASESDVAELGDGGTLLGLTTDAAWDTNDITFLVSNVRADDATEYAALTYTPLILSDGNEATLAQVAALESVTIPDFWLKGFRWLKVRSGTAAAAANQTGATTIRLSLRDVD